MAKKTSKVKVNRKVKRSARKTIGVLTLIMAIIVAAIPTPGARADDPSNLSTKIDVADVEYPDSIADDTDIKDLKPSNSDTKYNALMIFQTSDGGYEMWNAYTFYLTSVSSSISGSKVGVICDYNPAFRPQNGTLTISTNVVTKYPTFTEDNIKDFFQDGTITGDVKLSDKELERYYADEWEQYQNDLEEYDKKHAQWEKDHAQWVSNGSDPSKEPVEPTEPPKPSHKACELSWNDQLVYFCDHESSLTVMNSDGAYKLTQVADMTVSNTTGGGSPVTSIVYIPFNENNVGTNGSVAEGFYSEREKRYPIKYIGDDAFKGAANIETLIIPSEILQIGNHAFEGATGLRNVNAYAGIIGNGAFKNCASLESVTLTTGVKTIGTESFYGCNSLKSIVFPTTVEKIGKGSFAFCRGINSVDMSAINPVLIVDEFAFFECPALNSVSFAKFTKEIGKGAFAVEEGATGSWREVEFPSNITIFGDYVLAGRTNLKKVIMPLNYGSSSSVEIGQGFFKDCINLESVEFPDNGTGSCGYVKFSKAVFQDVLTEGFYIRGPEKDARGNDASPRKAAWEAGITYVYKDASGVDRWEVGTEGYRFTVANNGVLTSCVLTGSAGDFSGEVIVPSKIGDITVTGIGPNCFNSDENVKNNMKVLKIEDGSNISTIENQAFKGFPSLEKVYIGDSITTIGNEAFADCEKLTTVVFSTPKNGAYGSFKIGTDAFATNGKSLEFYGDIVEGYAPFDWAMNPDNYMNKSEMLRVCYRSGTPEAPNLTVILDNVSEKVTMIDYPHYDQLDEEIRNKYEKFLTGNYSSDEEIAMNASQTEQLNNVLHIVIPAGVESIDVKSYLAEQKNANNYKAYLTEWNESQNKYVTDSYYSTYRLEGLFSGYYGTVPSATLSASLCVGLLTSGSGSSGSEYREYPAGDVHELDARGNDRILSVEMSTVEYLPDNAFYSCENLGSVILGSAMQDIGTAPFSGCRNLVSVGGNDKYTCNNGIIYESNDTGKTIVECLSSRGTGVGTAFIDSETDPDIKKVTEIAEGAFENCAEIMSVDLSDATGLKVIPKNCFDGSTELNTVTLPNSVNEINKGAFTNTRKYLTVTIPAKEVSIDTGAFNETAILRSYEDSAVQRYARVNGHQFEEIDKIYTVHFLDYDGKEIDVQHVEAGRAATEPEHPKRDGYVFDKWSANFNNITEDTIVVAQYKTAASATDGANASGSKGTPTPTTNASVTPSSAATISPTAQAGTPTPTSTEKYKLTVVNGSGSGTYQVGTSVNITANAAPNGQVFVNWTAASNDFNIASSVSAVTTITMPDHDLIITANYGSSSNANGNGGSGSGSNGSNGTNGTGENGTNSTGGNGVNGSESGTVVDITKPGISNPDLASATVDGSTDNFVVKISDTAEARAAVEAALINEYGSLNNLSYFAMDISLYDSTGTTKIEDTSGLSVNITMPLPDDLIQYAGNNQAAGVVNGNVLDKLGVRFTTINGVPCVSFTATHFSPYTIYVDRANLSGGITDSTPKTGDLVHPKWFLVVALSCTSMILLLKKDKKKNIVTTA